MRRIRMIMVVLLGLTLGCELGGCQPSSNSPKPDVSDLSEAPSSEHPAASGRPPKWPFWPVKMRVHPLTRVVVPPTSSASAGDAGDAAASSWLIEARIEFQDVDGQPSKAVGQLSIQLADSPTSTATQGRIKTWNTDLRDLAVNREHYDDVTRTYLFRLSITPDELTDQSQVRALFFSTDGRKFEDRLLVRH